jgi:hypothetical protein
MKKKLQNLLLLAAALLFGFSNQAEASHFQGTELTYSCAATGIYQVQLKIFRDCSGAALPTTATLILKPQGCSVQRSVSMTQVPGSNTIGNYYCPQLGPPQCTASGRPNFETVTFRATVTFSATEQNCPNWMLTWTDCCRPETANILGQDDFYAEAYLNLAAGINNSSPVFASQIVPFVGKDAPIILSSHATEANGDSLVYSLQNPLRSAVTPIAYKTFNSTIIQGPSPSNFSVFPAGTYSSTFPLTSYYLDWSQPTPVTPVPNFVLDPTNGSLSFTPYGYVPNTPSVQGRNKYVVVVQVDEYRKINGTAVKVGSVRRDMLIIIEDCGPNVNPEVTAPVVNGQAITPATIINLRPGTPLNMDFATADGNPNSVLTLFSDVTSVLPGAAFTQTAGNQPTGTISWTPTNNDIRDQIYYFHVTTEDNACPVKGHQTQTFGVRVRATGGVTGAPEELSKNLSFVAFPNPYAETVSFKLEVSKAAVKQEILIYNSLGQQVDRISLKNKTAGEQQVVWEKGAKMAKGQYVAKLLKENQVSQTIQFTKL